MARLKSNPLSRGCGDGKSGRCLNADQVLTWSFEDSGYTKRWADSDKRKCLGLQLLQSSAGDSLRDRTLSCCLLTLNHGGTERLEGVPGGHLPHSHRHPSSPPFPAARSGSPPRHRGQPWCSTAAFCGLRDFSCLHVLQHHFLKPCIPFHWPQSHGVTLHRCCCKQAWLCLCRCLPLKGIIASSGPRDSTAPSQWKA